MFSRHDGFTETAVTNCPDCYSKGEIRVDCTRCSGCGKETCHECGGQSSLLAEAWTRAWPSCLRCDGTGREKCGACHGSGYKWGPCPTCAGEGELTLEALAALQERKRATQQQQEVEHWQYYIEEAQRWDEEVGQWFEQDLNRRIERRRLQREERRRRQWQLWKRRITTVTCCSVLIVAGLRWGPTGVLLAKTEAQRYLRPTPINPPAFVPSMRRLTEEDLRRKSPAALDALRHEILARRGLKMTRRDLAQRFHRQPWYRPDTTNRQTAWERLSPTEQYNLWFIAEHLTRRGPK